MSEKNYNKYLSYFLFSILTFYNFILIWLFAWNGESEYLLVAKGILEGFLPYQFSGSHKTPGTGILFAYIFSLFPYNVFTVRITIFVINIITLRLLWLTSGLLQFTRSQKWMIILLYFTALPLFGGTDLRGEHFIAFFSLLSFYLCVEKKLWENGSLLYLSAIGLSIFLCFIFKQTGLLYLFGYVLFFIILFFDKEIKPLNNIKEILIITGTSFFFILLFFFFYHLKGLAGLVWNNIFPQVLTAYPPQHSLKTAIRFIVDQIPLLWFFAFIGIIKLFKDYTGNRKLIPELLLLILMLFGTAVHLQKFWNYYTIQALPFIVLVAGYGIKAVSENRLLNLRFNKKLAFVLLLILLIPTVSRIVLNTGRFFHYLAKEAPAKVEYPGKSGNLFSIYTIWNDIALSAKIRSLTADREIIAMYNDHRYYFFADRFPPNRNVVAAAPKFDEDMADSIISKKVRNVIILELENFNMESPVGKVLKKYFPKKEIIRDSPTQVVLFSRNVPPVIFKDVKWEASQKDWIIVKKQQELH